MLYEYTCSAFGKKQGEDLESQKDVPLVTEGDIRQ